MNLKLSGMGPVMLALGMLAAACGPAGGSTPSSAGTAAPAAQGQATQTSAAAASPTQAPAAQ